MIAYDPTYGRQTSALSFIVNRPSVEHGFELERIQGPRPRASATGSCTGARRPARSSVGNAPMRGADPAANGA